MRKSIFIGTALALASVAAIGLTANAHDDKSHGADVTETYDFEGFERIALGGVYKMNVTVGPDYSITLSGDSQLMDDVNVYLDGSELNLDTKNNKKKRKQHNNGITADITLPKLSALSVAGVASGDITGVDADDFDLSVSGVAEVNIDGTCKSLKARVSGVGELDARDFKCSNADVSLSGVGEMSVYASSSVDVRASGVGEVVVYGKPEDVKKSKAMFTKITIK